MRGTRTNYVNPDCDRGIIPADAGNTTYGSRLMAHTPDHPRGCGEHSAVSLSSNAIEGSSPRMRGTRRMQQGAGLLAGIIPADAGNTQCSDSAMVLNKDHPRGCGEHLDNPFLVGVQCGSSPRMRGTPGPGIRVPSPSRIIPADAGNTVSSASADGADEDHPRGCGEHRSAPGASTDRAGSSPRMRGTLSAHAHMRGEPRIIPADAGNTSGRQPNRARRRDHPRGCGEHVYSS